MKNAVLTAALILTALGAMAEGLPQMLGSDPLSIQILTKTAQENGGVTAAVRVGSGQAIELKLSDLSFPAAQLAPAAASPVLNLKPAAGLTRKSAKTKTRKPARRAVDQLKRAAAAAAGKSWR